MYVKQYILFSTVSICTIFDDHQLTIIMLAVTSRSIKHLWHLQDYIHQSKSFAEGDGCLFLHDLCHRYCDISTNTDDAIKFAGILFTFKKVHVAKFKLIIPRFTRFIWTRVSSYTHTSTQPSIPLPTYLYT